MRPLTKYFLPGRPRPGIHAARIFISAKRRLYEERESRSCSENMRALYRKQTASWDRNRATRSSAAFCSTEDGQLSPMRCKIAPPKRSQGRLAPGVFAALIPSPLIRTDVPNCAGRWTYCPWLVDEAVPGKAAVIDDLVIGLEYAIGEPVVAGELPDVFDRVGLGRSTVRRAHGAASGTPPSVTRHLQGT